MLELMTSFGLCDVTGGCMLFNGFFASFLQSQIVDGPPKTKTAADNVKAYYLFNTAFGEADFTHVWAMDQTTIGVHLYIKFAKDGVSTGEPVTNVMDWYRISAGATPLFILHLASGGVITVRDGSGGTVGTLAPTFFFDTWYEFEFKSGQFGWQVLVNGVNAASSPTPTSTSHADRAEFRWQGFGPPGIAVAHYVLWDDRPGDGISDFIGSCWVSTLPVLGDINAVWAATPGPKIYTALRDPSAPFGNDTDGSPDGDASYAVPTALSPPQLFNIGQPGSPCFGLILAVAVNICGRPIAGDQLVEAWVRPKLTISSLGQVQLAASGTRFTQYAARQNYQTWQVLSTLSPETGTNWTDSELAGGQWGVAPASDANENFRLTQFYVTKLTSLGNKSYTCGGGPYVY